VVDASGGTAYGYDAFGNVLVKGAGNNRGQTTVSDSI